MVLIRIITEATWPCIEQAVDHISKIRKDAPQLARQGLNFSIVLGSACYLEGVLETLLHAALAHQRSIFSKVKIPDFDIRRSMNVFYNRIEDDLEDRIARSLGAEGYGETFALLTGTPLKQLELVTPLWEAVTILFNFRNVLGHGRRVRAVTFSGAAVEGGFREEYSGSYRRVEDYLRKIQLIDDRFPEGKAKYLFLRDDIADHFWNVAKQVPAAIVASLPPVLATGCKKALEAVRSKPLDI